MVGGFQYSFYFHTENWGFMIQFDEHIFQMGGSTTTLYIYIYIYLPSGPDSLNNAWLAGTLWESTKWYWKPSRAWPRDLTKFWVPNSQLENEQKSGNFPTSFKKDIQTINLKWKCVWLVIGHVFFVFFAKCCVSLGLCWDVWCLFQNLPLLSFVCGFLSSLDVRCLFWCQNHAVCFLHSFRTHTHNRSCGGVGGSTWRRLACREPLSSDTWRGKESWPTSLPKQDLYITKT